MQATVASFDAGTRSGTVLLDDGLELPFDAAAFNLSGMRTARLGQRVRIQLAGDAQSRRVSGLTLATFPDLRSS